MPEFLQGVALLVSERGTRLSNFADHISKILQNPYQYFCRKPFKIFAETFSAVLQKTSQHFLKITLGIFVEHISVVLLDTSQYFFENISKYFCVTPCSIFKNTHREKAPALAKSMSMDIWVVGISNQLFIRGSYTKAKFSRK